MLLQAVTPWHVISPSEWWISHASEEPLGSGRFWVNSPWNLYLEKIPWEGEFTLERVPDPSA